nr:putative 2-hydroxy-3-oxopropionate reductase [Candidatus Pantoea persica]
MASAIETGFREIFLYATCVKIPVADGGEGTVEAMVATKGSIVNLRVSGPPDAFYGLSGDACTAFIEMVAASGLELVPTGQRAPLTTTSFGTGELIQSVLDKGVEHIIIGIGGNATNDGGAGMMQALGALLLLLLAQIDISALDSRVRQCRFKVACDVTNPLTGRDGASAIFGPQKGATPELVAQLDRALAHYAAIIQRDLDIDVLHIPGGGRHGRGAARLLPGGSATRHRARHRGAGAGGAGQRRLAGDHRRGAHRQPDHQR